MLLNIAQTGHQSQQLFMSGHAGLLRGQKRRVRIVPDLSGTGQEYGSEKVLDRMDEVEQQEKAKELYIISSSTA